VSTPWLEVVAGESAERRFDLPPGASLVLGRAETCDVKLPDVDLSREHVRFTRRPAATSVTDLGSKNGTFVQHQRLAPHTERPLRDGERIVVGTTILVYRAEPEPEPAAVADPAPADPAPAADPDPAPRRLLDVPAVVALVLVLAALLCLVELLHVL
jgi:predicted component of type VI protein secretion system